MPLCKDRATKELAEKGYSLVRYPRPNIAPLDMIAGSRSPLEWLGPLTECWKGATNPPNAIQGDVPDFIFKQSSDFKGSIGVRILQGLIQNIGGKADANVSISSTLSFTYDAPKLYAVSPASLGNYLKEGDLDTAHPMIRRFLKIDNAIDSRFFVVTEVLQARKLLVEVTSTSAGNAAADVETLKNLASGNLSIQGQSGNSVQVAFDGGVYLTFAFRAFEFAFITGRWEVMGVTGGDDHLGPADAAIFGEHPITFRAALEGSAA
jgi:hypothetical protein